MLYNLPYSPKFYFSIDLKLLEEETIFSTEIRGDDNDYVPLVVAIMGIHFFISNIILLNLLIAIFK